MIMLIMMMVVMMIMMNMMNIHQSDELFLFTGHTMASSSTEILTAELPGVGALLLYSNQGQEPCAYY